MAEIEMESAEEDRQRCNADLRDENARLRAALLNLCAKSFEAYAYIGPEPKPRDQYDQYDCIAATAWEAAMDALGEEVRQWMSKARG